MRAHPTGLSPASSVAFMLEHFNKTGVCVRICSLDCSDSSGWIVLSSLLLWSSVEKGFIYIYVYKAWQESAVNFSARSPFLSHLRTRARMFGSAEHPRVFRNSWISGKEEPHCFGSTCTLSLLWACSKRFLHVGMWSWYLTGSKNKAPWLSEIPFLEDGLWHKTGRYHCWLLKQEGRERTAALLGSKVSLFPVMGTTQGDFPLLILLIPFPWPYSKKSFYKRQRARWKFSSCHFSLDSLIFNITV